MRSRRGTSACLESSRGQPPGGADERIVEQPPGLGRQVCHERRRLARVLGRYLALAEPVPELRQSGAKVAGDRRVRPHGCFGEIESDSKIGRRCSLGELDHIFVSQGRSWEKDLWVGRRLTQGHIDRAEHCHSGTPLRVLRDFGLCHAELDAHIGVVRVEQEVFHKEIQPVTTDILRANGGVPHKHN